MQDLVLLVWCRRLPSVRVKAFLCDGRSSAQEACKARPVSNAIVSWAHLPGLFGWKLNENLVVAAAARSP